MDTNILLYNWICGARSSRRIVIRYGGGEINPWQITCYDGLRRVAEGRERTIGKAMTKAVEKLIAKN